MKPLTNYSWDVPRRQSPAAIFIMLLRTAVWLIKTFWPILVIYFLRKQKDSEGLGSLWFVIGFGVIAIIGSIIRYLFYKFHVSQDSLIIQTGWLKKKTLTVPLKNIQAVHLEQNLWQQFLKVAKVTLDSAGSEKAEVKIDALSIPVAEELKQLLLSESKNSEMGDEVPVKEKGILRLSLADLFKLSLSANHLEAFFILFGICINLLEDVKKIFNINGWNVMEDYAGKMKGQEVIAVSILIILVAIISIIISIVRTAVKFYDFRLEQTTQGWKIFFGLLNRQQLIVPFNKIQILSWRANWIRKKLDFWIIHVQSIGHDEMKTKQHIHIPVTRLQQAISLAASYQSTPVFNVKEGSGIASAYWKRKVLFRSVPGTFLFTLIIYLISGDAGAWISLLLIPLLALYHYTWYRNFRYTVNGEGIQMYRGVWGRRYTLLVWKKIQQLETSQNLYQQSHDLASLKFTTAGGKLSLLYIPFEQAKQLTDQILYLVESKKEGWM